MTLPCSRGGFLIAFSGTANACAHRALCAPLPACAAVCACVCVLCVRYVDVILQCISLAGDFVTEDIWYRVVQIVTNHEDLQEYAATTCYKFLEASNVHENGVKVAAYILGEFGDQIAKEANISGPLLFELLHSKFRTSSNSTKALLLSAYIKMANTYPELKAQVNAVFSAHRDSHDSEIQQRACEYYVMNTTASPKLMESVFDVMPNFNERESLLLKRMKKNVKVGPAQLAAERPTQPPHRTPGAPALCALPRAALAHRAPPVLCAQS